MASRPSKKPEPSSKKQQKPRSRQLNDDWADVAEPEERRRIQNRLAQRKFREKAKEQKEKAERESHNLKNAHSSYQLPSSDEITSDDGIDLSGLPWGSMSMRHVLAMGYETESRRSGGSGGDNTPTETPQYYTTTDSYQQYQATSYGDSSNSSGGDDYSYQDIPSFYYDLNTDNGHNSYHQT
ncbi:uncharacterized protein GGS22DRAFT_163275 [Annulohypoxylon maeteangense]|uniref:uncharacterized protein n=1 Tax=Annulohypoxylon maeteangense TaxID=1927788 RepID=UPI002007CE40|nr:uncharacterized protein GGS22DRAFT_163275 [Annulohypoxylon maeteangense]KAI0885266.1 hypothetical protein GGS22DRAFT_163275 [Annulohypoxylon maeteangense]